MNYRKFYKDYHGVSIDGLHIHHIDGDNSNNSIDNLVALTPENHFTIHWLQWLMTGSKKEEASARFLLTWINPDSVESRRRKLKSKSPWNKDLSMWDDKEHPKGMLGKNHSPETKNRMAEYAMTQFKNLDRNTIYVNHPKGMLGKNHSEEVKMRISESVSRIMKGKRKSKSHKKALSEARKKTYIIEGVEYNGIQGVADAYKISYACANKRIQKGFKGWILPN